MGEKTYFVVRIPDFFCVSSIIRCLIISFLSLSISFSLVAVSSLSRRSTHLLLKTSFSTFCFSISLFFSSSSCFRLLNSKSQKLSLLFYFTVLPSTKLYWFGEGGGVSCGSSSVSLSFAWSLLILFLFPPSLSKSVPSEFESDIL